MPAIFVSSASDRDKGKVQFAYYEQMSGWLDETPGFFQALDASNGVKLEKLERFVYRLTYGGKSVIFELNDLSRVKPPADALAPKETFIGPVFDNFGRQVFSGLQCRGQQLSLHPRRNRQRNRRFCRRDRAATAFWSASARGLYFIATDGATGKS